MSEPQILQIKVNNAKAGIEFRTTDLSSIPVEIGLQGEDGFPHLGHMDYASPQVDASTGTLEVRAIFDNKDRRLLPGLFVRVRTPVAKLDKRDPCARSGDRNEPGGALSAGRGAGQCRPAQERQDGRPRGGLRIIESGIDPGDWIVTEGVQRAIPGAKVDPQQTKLSAEPENPPSLLPPQATPRSRPRRRQRNDGAGETPMISRFFIDRPVLANVLALFFVVIGLVSLVNLPTSQYPNVVPPTVQVTTRYPGASASTLVNTVGLPIEQNVNGVENMLYMQSTSASDGTYNLTSLSRSGRTPTRTRSWCKTGSRPRSRPCPRKCRSRA